VGDSADDFAAAHAARCFGTVMVRHSYNEHCIGRGDVDVVIDRLDELVGMLEAGFTVQQDEE
jgi:phosphoglycolate phosphatase-like HAD superfamily hydrolase